MSTATKHFPFGVTEGSKEGWEFNAGGGSELSDGVLTGEPDSPNDPSSGYFMRYVLRSKAKTNGSPYIEWIGTLSELLGISAEDVVTALKLDYDWRVSQATSPAPGLIGPAEFWADGTSEFHTASSAEGFEAITSWATNAGTNVTGLSLPGSTKIHIRIGTYPCGAKSTSLVRLLIDWVTITAEYGEAKKEAVSLTPTKADVQTTANTANATVRTLIAPTPAAIQLTASAEITAPEKPPVVPVELVPGSAAIQTTAAASATVGIKLTPTAAAIQTGASAAIKVRTLVTPTAAAIVTGAGTGTLTTGAPLAPTSAAIQTTAAGQIKRPEPLAPGASAIVITASAEITTPSPGPELIPSPAAISIGTGTAQLKTAAQLAPGMAAVTTSAGLAEARVQTLLSPGQAELSIGASLQIEVGEPVLVAPHLPTRATITPVGAR
jgi:hypothetical protein